ncbi:MAG TPA: NlpC/P60 family protein [Amaricoccus sp.]|uniref:NlpC/P60 family protein n=1 Tax=Amaricoccus sp. TaxID=1872485 RepID=UPI002BA90A4B|nr:NlpC/P60 family protein [Amaricoccus sp.]HMQ94147.1 NlpC/P60 family protein [Amaricoccus sp.]HMR51506.1 NlpC/P60 family protein [Amaricoccus sp.]HMR60651.1 NlpC/P60 family protein [Amaricoccus sp.]HMT98482.1 NlpC/P60 family protein [Amaricoccus sp.]
MTAAAYADPDPDQGGEIVARARAWIGTPYRHQASCRGAGTDCLGLLRGIWREIHGEEPEAVPAYTPDWSEPQRSEDLLAAAGRHLLPVAERRPGDVLVLRMRDGSVAKHVGILAVSPQGFETLIHAYSGHGVVESALTPAWARRIAGIFRFPMGRS